MSGSIKFKDIRVGDRVRAAETQLGVTVTYEGAVTKLNSDYLVLGDQTFSLGYDLPYELVERPKPELKAGQIWRRDDGNQLQTVWDDNAVVLFVDQQGYLRGKSYWDREGHRLEYVGDAEIGVKS